jgi:hypothetical protein
MRSLLLAALLPAVAACAPALAQDAGSPPAAGAGPLHVTLRGDYVGKQIRISADGRVIENRRFTFPPPGAEDRLTTGWSEAGTVRLKIEIEGCPAIWEQDVAVAPFRSASLIFDGCAIEALQPE